MRVVLLYHSLISDWNHGNAHFLRGVVSELIARGHDVTVYEPADAWSVQGMVSDGGADTVHALGRRWPELRSVRYDPATLDIEQALAGAELVLVHEWNEPALVAGVGQALRGAPCTLLFHDTHHRAVTEPETMARFDLREYDGVLAFGAVLRDVYLRQGWAERAWTWHEAADVRRFQPVPRTQREGDLVWIGNWGDDERTIELMRYLVLPVSKLNLRVRVHGVRYPAAARALLAEAGMEYAGWLPNHAAAETFSRFDVTVHVPRRAYVEQLPGIPTIRVFEALACGIPLVSAPWEDSESLFTAGHDYLSVTDGKAMERALYDVLHDRTLAQELAAAGRRTILERHTCGHRVDELMKIHESVAGAASSPRHETPAGAGAAAGEVRA